MIGGINDDGEIDHAMMTIIYKTGKKDSQDRRLFKSKRRNAKTVEKNDDNKLFPQSGDEVNELCTHSTDNICRDHSIDAESEIVRILHFKQFQAFCIFRR